jgi:hypothetical protein
MPIDLWPPGAAPGKRVVVGFVMAFASLESIWVLPNK